MPLGTCNGTKKFTTNRRLTREEFNQQVVKYVEAIESIKDKQSAIKKNIRPGQWYKPSEHRDVSICTVTAGEYFRSLHDQIEKSDYLPLSVVPYRSSLLLALKRVNQQVLHLNQLLVELKETAITEIDQWTKKQQDIQRSLEKIVLETEEILDHLHFLLHRSRFQEKINTSATIREFPNCAGIVNLFVNLKDADEV